MCYERKLNIKIKLQESYKIIRNCSGCGKKSTYVNTNNFRVNANGRKVDVWLIYQCQECKHTYNLSIFERVKPEEISREQYEKYLANDKVLSDLYGMDKSLFLRNKAIIDNQEIQYRLVENTEKLEAEDVRRLTLADIRGLRSGDILEIKNPFGIKVRVEKILGELLNMSRSKVEKLLSVGILEVEEKCTDSMIRVKIIGKLEIME
jgi:hypothetical protein